MPHARHRACRGPVGRRGQGQGHRPARGPRRLRGQVPGREQRRPHGRHRRRELRPAPAAVRGAVARRRPGDRQRRGDRPAGAAGRDRRAGRPRRGLLQAARLGQRAPDHAVPPGAGQGHRAVPGQRADRHHRPRHRPGLRRQDRPDRDPRPGPVRPRHPAAEARPGAAREEPDADQGLQPARHRRRGDRGRVRAVRRTAPALRGRHRAGPGPGAGPGRGGAARGRPGHHARRGPRHLPVRHLLLPHRGRRLRRVRHRPDPDLRRHRHRQGLHDPRRRGALPHRTPRRAGRMAAQVGRRVRRDHRPAAPLRLVRRGHRPVRDPGERHHRLLPDQARRAVRPGPGAGLRGLRGGRQAARRDPDDADRVPPRDAGLRVLRRLVGGHLQGPDVRRAAGQRAGLHQRGGGDDRRPGLRGRRRPAPRPDPADQGPAQVPC